MLPDPPAPDDDTVASALPLDNPLQLIFIPEIFMFVELVFVSFIVIV